MANQVYPEFDFNFVFFFMRGGFMKSIFGKELLQHPQVRSYQFAINGPAWMQRLFRYHWSYTVNRKIRLPFKRIWFKRMYRQSFKNDKPLCFVYLGGNCIVHNGGWCKYVRKQDSRNKQVVLHLDLIEKKITDYPYSFLRDQVDLCITYDIGDARRYNIPCYAGKVYSRIRELPAENNYKQDIYYLGAAKDRLQKFYDAYDLFTDAGLSCKFLLAYVPSECRIERQGIVYLDKEISYEENIENVLESRCILEILQEGAVRTTLRSGEALAYGCRFITDAQELEEELYYSGQLVRFRKLEDIDIEVVKSPFNREKFTEGYIHEPFARLEFIQQELMKV